MEREREGGREGETERGRERDEGETAWLGSFLFISRLGNSFFMTRRRYLNPADDSFQMLSGRPRGGQHSDNNRPGGEGEESHLSLSLSRPPSLPPSLSLCLAGVFLYRGDSRGAGGAERS